MDKPREASCSPQAGIELIFIRHHCMMPCDQMGELDATGPDTSVAKISCNHLGK